MPQIRRLLVALALLAALVPAARAADHVDGPLASMEPAGDFADVYTWMTPDARQLIVVGTFFRNANAASRFSNAIQYVFHTRSQASFGAAAGVDYDLICEFDNAEPQVFQCWAGDDLYVTGNAFSGAGAQTANGRFRAFAGLRNDPFFFSLDSFNATRAIVRDAAPSLTFDQAGCPQLDPATAAFLVNSLETAPGGGPAFDHFGNFNAITIVLTVDRSLVTRGGPIVSVWGGTYRK